MSIIHSTTETTRLLARKAENGQLRLLGPEIYSDDLQTPIDTLRKREAVNIATTLNFTGRLGHASALGNSYDKTHGNKLFLFGIKERVWKGGDLEIIQFKGSQTDLSPIGIEDYRVDKFLTGMKTSSFARAILENMSPSLVHQKKSNQLGARLELEAFYQNHSEAEREVFEQNIKRIGQELYPKSLSIVVPIIDKMKKTPLKTVDFGVLSTLEKLAPALINLNIKPIEGVATDAELFLECYFSNYIEGTCLTVEEALSLLTPQEDGMIHTD
jgi:hypothetical protein